MKTLTAENIKSVRVLYAFLDELNIEDKKQVAERMADLENDFEVENYRFIHKDEIDEIQRDELASDPYILGCFNAWFIADNTDLSINIVEALQKGDQYTELGHHIIDNGYLSDIQKEYASADGYGHHFASYDGHEHEHGEYYAFRIN